MDDVVRTTKLVVMAAVLMAFAGCGADHAEMDAPPAAEDDAPGANAENAAVGNDMDDGDNGMNEDNFVPEEEEFVVQQVASTDSYVFVPNEAEGSDTVAVIDGRDFGVHPVRVGLEPSKVVATEHEEPGSIGYVLSSGEPTVAVVRAEHPGAEDFASVELLRVPREVNQLAVSPDGRHVLAYIDPDLEPNDTASAVSLQTMALIRLGDEPGQDRVFELSVTRFIDDIAFDEDSEQAFVVGEEGINRIPLHDIKADAFLESMPLDVMEAPIFEAEDHEVIFSDDGSVLAVRTSEFSGVGIFELDDEEDAFSNHRIVDLDGVPTDIDFVDGEEDGLRLLAPVRSEEQIAVLSVEEALDADVEEPDESFLRILEAPNTDTGIGRLTPDETAMAVFSTVPDYPRVGLLDLETETIETYELRNQIRTLEISPNSRTAVAVHRRQQGDAPVGDAEAKFRHSEGLTLWDLETGFRGPVRLDGDPREIVMTEDSQEVPHLFAMLTPTDDPDAQAQGIERINLDTHARNFVSLPREPTQLGVVGNHIFVSQKQETGRITFIDVDTNQQRTVSGYELNAGIE